MYKNFYVSYWGKKESGYTCWQEPTLYEDGSEVEKLVSTCKDNKSSVRVERMNCTTEKLECTYEYINDSDIHAYLAFRRKNPDPKNENAIDSITKEEAQDMLKKLDKHFGCPVMPVNQYCRALETWADCIVKLNEQEKEEYRYYQGQDYYKHLHHIMLDIQKSNLLWRLIYCDQELRTEPCPLHKGHWSGYTWEGCIYGCGELGWLPK